MYVSGGVSVKDEMKELSERIGRLKRELRLLRLLYPEKRAVVSFRGMAKANVPLEEIDRSVEGAKKSLFKYE